MIVRLKDGTEFFATKDQADQLWQYKLNGQPWQFGEYRGDAGSIYIIKPGGTPPLVRDDRRIAAPPVKRASAATVQSTREILEARGIVKPKIGAKA